MFVATAKHFLPNNKLFFILKNAFILLLNVFDSIKTHKIYRSVFYLSQKEICYITRLATTRLRVYRNPLAKKTGANAHFYRCVVIFLIYTSNYLITVDSIVCSLPILKCVLSAPYVYLNLALSNEYYTTIYK